MKSQIITNTLKKFAFLTATLTIALGVSYALAQTTWQEPSSPPPADNVAAPINVSTNAQTKPAMLTTAISRAAQEVRSIQYCDYDGNNCWDPTTGTSPVPGGGGDLTPENGYQWVGPLLFQWGRECPGTTANYPFPTPFPNQVLQVVGGGSTPNPGATRANHTAVAVDNATVQVSTPWSAVCTSYIAIGY